MQSFFVFGGGGTIAKFKSKLSLCLSRWFHLFRPNFLKWALCRKLSSFDPSRPFLTKKTSHFIHTLQLLKEEYSLNTHFFSISHLLP